MDSLRTFIALSLPYAARRAAHKWLKDLGLDPIAVRAVPEDQMHITIKFLGQVSLDVIEPLTNIIQDAADLHAPIIRFTEYVLVPPKRPSVLALGVEPVKELFDIFTYIENQIAEQRIARPESRRLRPHVTMARSRLPISLDGINVPGLPGGEWPATQLALYESRLSSQGPQYTILTSIELN